MRKWVIVAFLICLLSLIGYKIYDRFFYSGEFVIAKVISPGVYHRVDCPLVKKSTANNIIVMSKEQIARNEYRPCKTCNPPYDTEYVLEIRKVKEQEKKAAEIKRAEEHKNKMLKMKEDYINGRNRSVENAIDLYSEQYLNKEDLIKYRAYANRSLIGLPSYQDKINTYKNITGKEPIYIPWTASEVKKLKENY